MTSVPHSGNRCSGMCETPCDHVDCWQCEGDYLKRYGPDKAMKRKLRLELAEADARAKAVKSIPPPTKPVPPLKPTKVTVSGPPPWGVGANATTVVSRQVLEGLTKRAGVEMYWNDGNPVFAEQYNLRPLGDALTWKQQEEGVAIDDGASEEDVKAAERLLKNARDPLRLTSGQFTVAQLNEASTSLAQHAAKGLDDIMKDIVIQGAKTSALTDLYRDWLRTQHPMVGSGAVDGRATVEK